MVKAQTIALALGVATLIESVFSATPSCGDHDSWYWTDQQCQQCYPYKIDTTTYNSASGNYFLDSYSSEYICQKCSASQKGTCDTNCTYAGYSSFNVNNTDIPINNYCGKCSAGDKTCCNRGKHVKTGDGFGWTAGAKTTYIGIDCWSSSDNCIDASGNPTSCVGTYTRIFEGSTCYYLAGCSAYTKYGKCQTCMDGYFINKSQECSTCNQFNWNAASTQTSGQTFIQDPTIDRIPTTQQGQDHFTQSQQKNPTQYTTIFENQNPEYDIVTDSAKLPSMTGNVCQSCNGPNQCTKCAAGYYLGTNENRSSFDKNIAKYASFCMPCNNGCICDNESQLCLSCQANWFKHPEQNECLPCDSKSYQWLEYCNQCEWIHELQYPVCTECLVSSGVEQVIVIDRAIQIYNVTQSAGVTTDYKQCTTMAQAIKYSKKLDIYTEMVNPTETKNYRVQLKQTSGYATSSTYEYTQGNTNYLDYYFDLNQAYGQTSDSDATTNAYTFSMSTDKSANIYNRLDNLWENVFFLRPKEQIVTDNISNGPNNLQFNGCQSTGELATDGSKVGVMKIKAQQCSEDIDTNGLCSHFSGSDGFPNVYIYILHCSVCKEGYAKEQVIKSSYNYDTARTPRFWGRLLAATTTRTTGDYDAKKWNYYFPINIENLYICQSCQHSIFKQDLYINKIYKLKDASNDFKNTIVVDPYRWQLTRRCQDTTVSLIPKTETSDQTNYQAFDIIQCGSYQTAKRKNYLTSGVSTCETNEAKDRGLSYLGNVGKGKSSWTQTSFCNYFYNDSQDNLSAVSNCTETTSQSETTCQTNKMSWYLTNIVQNSVKKDDYTVFQNACVPNRQLCKHMSATTYTDSSSDLAFGSAGFKSSDCTSCFEGFHTVNGQCQWCTSWTLREGCSSCQVLTDNDQKQSLACLTCYNKRQVTSQIGNQNIYNTRTAQVPSYSWVNDITNNVYGCGYNDYTQYSTQSLTQAKREQRLKNATPTNYFYDSEKNECDSCNLGCLDCQKDKYCTQAQNFYRIKEQAGEDKSNTEFEKCIVDYCINCDTAVDVCDTCQPGFALFKWTNSTAPQAFLGADDEPVTQYYCERCDPGCKTCTGDSASNIYARKTCTVCFDGYFLKDGTCHTQRSGCINWKIEGGECLQCDTGYRLEQGWCYTCFDSDAGFYRCPVYQNIASGKICDSETPLVSNNNMDDFQVHQNQELFKTKYGGSFPN